MPTFNGTTTTDTTSSTDIDLTGMRRVKTKHMDIETHNPVDVQRARDKENAPHPSFCGLHFCIATPKNA